MSERSERIIDTALREALTERSEGERVSELASESWAQRSREAPTERSEGER